MPFDSATFQRPTVTVLPPQGPLEPPERGGRPPRIHIEIEIVDRRRAQQRPPGHRFGTLTLTLWLIVLLAALAGCTAAHAQPTSWQSHSDGYLTRYQGIDGNGEPWRTGTSGFTTYFDANGPHGEQQLCRSWQEGWQTITECD
jgi:hypothetical protein